jgi:hypothetical protein
MGIGRHLLHATDDVFDAVDREKSLQTEKLDTAGLTVQKITHLDARLTSRGRIGTGVDASERHGGRADTIEHMKPEIVGHLFADFDAAHAVALFVQAR